MRDRRAKAEVPSVVAEENMTKAEIVGEVKWEL